MYAILDSSKKESKPVEIVKESITTSLVRLVNIESDSTERTDDEVFEVKNHRLSRLVLRNRKNIEYFWKSTEVDPGSGKAIGRTYVKPK